MDNTLLINLSSQLASYQAMEVVANNLANMTTSGFKRDTPQFLQYLQPVRAVPGQPSTGTLSFVQNAGVLRDMSQGATQTTGNPFDLAIAGKGFFQVQTPNGVRYSRDGHFSLNQDGQIVDETGNLLVGDGGPIAVAPEDGAIHIAPDGTVSGIKGQLGTVKLVDFADEGDLTKEGNNLYRTSAQPQPATGQILQGMIEGSNVQPIAEMTRMIQIMRSYQAMSTLTQSQQQLMTQAIDKLGSIQS